jgi:hydrogenase maturation protease
VGVADLLDGARWLDRYPRRLVLLGLVPASMELAVGLSPAVQPALPDLVQRIVDEARQLGFDFRLRTADDTPPVEWPVAGVAHPAGMRGW